ncbi:hypothetical protein LguiB_030045 [Lonicera macranthoides]
MVESSLTSEYRSINIFINLCRDPKYKYKVPMTNFSPQSKVTKRSRVFWWLQLRKVEKNI